MICKNCGANLADDAQYCYKCGTVFVQEQKPQQAPAYEQAPVYEQPQAPAYEQPAYSQPQAPVINSEEDLPEKYRPLGAWTYFWLSLLFTIPVVGFVFLIIFSVSDGNIHRRNFARSHWCALIIFAAIFAVIFTISLIAGASLFAAFSY